MKLIRTACTVFICLCIFNTAHSQQYKSSSAIWMENSETLRNQHFVVFPEVREKPIQWFDSIAVDKIGYINHPTSFSVNAQPGEFFVYQVGVLAIKNDVNNVKVKFSALAAKNGKSISPAKMSCFNLGGIDFKGHPFTKQVNISAGRVQALWMGIDLEDAATGLYTGTVSVTSGKETRTIPIRLQVTGSRAVNHGYNEGKRLARLNWLNSTAGIDNKITRNYIPVQRHNNTISILGRTLDIDQTGLPASIETFFTASNQKLAKNGEPLLNAPFRFIVEKEDGEIVALKPGKLRFLSQESAKAAWTVLNTSTDIDVSCTGKMEFDGFVDYQLTVISRKPVRIKDIRLEIPVSKDKSVYMMGLNHEGGLRPGGWKWKWDATKNQDMLWMGDVNGGLRIKWKAENYKRPLVNIYYEFGPLQMPPSWENNGNGGVDITEKNDNVLITAYSGERELTPGKPLHYDFELLITPFKLIDKQTKFEDRYYHGGGTNTAVKIANAQKAGANIINIHQAEDIYPFINYPYLDENTKALTTLVTNAHKAGMRMKLYYTTRELTKNLPEFWALNSLHGEVIFPGPGNATRTEALHPKGPNEWLVKNVRENYIPAWYNLIDEGKFKGEIDLSVITTPDSRLNNFYIAGLNWMVKNMGIDGVYIDDAALDRFTLIRARKIIDNNRPDGKMDLHSWNHFNKWAGYASCLNLYMDLLPYLDLAWIGEGRNYNRSPDHWLIEVSGIPFGITGQMLEGGGNPWRGMVYGITTRAGWTKNPPSELWKFFDEYHFTEKELSGYWDKNCPITCNDSLVKASVYNGKDEAIIAVANWTETDREVSLLVNWKNLGMDPATCDISIPEIKDYQTKQAAVALDKITIPGKKGYLILLKKKK